MRRKVDPVAALWLLAASLATVGLLVWSWRRTSPDASISCGGRMNSCSSGFGDEAAMICTFAAPLLAWLVYKAFFHRFRQ